MSSGGGKSPSVHDTKMLNPSPPASGERRAGIGLSLNTNDKGELCVRKVIPGGPAAFSCQIAVGDSLMMVDGVDVVGETTEEVARRIVGPEGEAITLTFRSKRTAVSGQSVRMDNDVSLIRQFPVTIPEKLVKAQLGLGVELKQTDGDFLKVHSMLDGGGAALSGKLLVGDVIQAIDGRDLSKVPSGTDKPLLLLGPPYSRVSLLVDRDGKIMPMDLVRTVPLIGEYLMKHSAYMTALEQAILRGPRAAVDEDDAELPPHKSPGQAAESEPAPSLERKVSKSTVGEVPPPGRRKTSRGSNESFESGHSAASNTSSEELPLVSIEDALSNALLQVPTTTPGFHGGPVPGPLTAPVQALAANMASMVVHGRFFAAHPPGPPSEGTNQGQAIPLDAAPGGESEGGGPPRQPYTRSRRDSIATNVKSIFGEAYDALRTLDGREATFTSDWPHGTNPKLGKSKMASAGFIYTPDDSCSDKTTCVYCGLELGHWEPGDDPWTEHHHGSPGCSFWRRSSVSGEKINRDLLFTGYGSPYHSLYRQAANEMQESLRAHMIPHSNTDGLKARREE
eukprot:CAMPEP_0206245122 /NCGR_PEP_ID=MMETSP0047_2-20121206/18526_1 /ASSEMBLY_ACC=CAM_ASM_000192 /TAXON_ID=195065 /ORGANISM="Chroomonas mesostigmatica_cf, Strain CCMP1168" /LENGTH=564 /DNA_ID=CAMNT_0053670395 /DNA_START=122 /DNA_END=1814 /DNA_ORIENTATION=+